MFLDKLKQLFRKESKARNVNFESIPSEAYIKTKQATNVFEQTKLERKMFLVKTEKETVLNVKYNTQRDNLLYFSKSCNVTSLEMSMSSCFTKEHENKLISMFSNANFHPKIYDIVVKYGFHNLNLDDKLFSAINTLEFRNYLLKKYPRETWMKNYFDDCAGVEVFASLVEIVNLLLEDSRYATMNKRLTLDLIMKEINNGYPVIICGKFTGGHFVTVVGYNLVKNVLVVHDPWGNWNTRYKDKNGAFVGYSIPKLFVPEFLFTMPILVHFDKRIPI